MTHERTDEANDAKTNLRLPHDLLDRMRRLARTDDRSLNAEIVRAIKEFVERHEQQPSRQAS
jgi:predicted transcriptional regulator